MKKSFLLLTLFYYTLSTYSQIVTITDAETGNPIELATIYSEKPDLATLTNTHGQADLTEFKNAGKIEIRLVGYEPLITNFAEIARKDFRINLIQASISLDEVVVSASNWNQISSDLPQKIISIQPNIINLLSPQTTADLLGISGKVFIQKSQQGGGSPMIRGFATNRLLYTVDGVRMNTAIFRGGNIQNVISLDPFALEHTEVLFGAGSVIYGSDAIGGVMSFQTLHPQFSLNNEPFVSGKAVTRFSSANNEITNHIDVNVGWKKWASITSFSYSSFGDLKMGSYGPDEYLRPFYVQRQNDSDLVLTNPDPKVQIPSGYSQINMMQKLRYSPNKKWFFDYGFHYSETSAYSRYDRHIRYKNGGPRYGEWDYGPQIWMMNNLNISNTCNNLFYDQMSIRLAYQYFEESRISRDFNSNERENRNEKVYAYSANIDYIKTRNRNKFFYGAEAVVNEINSTGINENIAEGTAEKGASRYPQSTWQSYAVYISNQLDVFDWMKLNTGIRYSQFIIDAIFDTTFYPFPFTSAYINNNAITGNFGIVFRPENTFVISVNLSTAYRSPNIDDIGKVFDSEQGAVTVPNPDLEAEYAYNVDLGLTKIFSETIKIELSAYYTLLNNAMVRRDYMLNGKDSIYYDGVMSKVQAIQNAAKATVYGVQAGMEIKLPAGFVFSTDVNYQKGEEELDGGTTSPSRHAAPMFINARIKYNTGKLNMQLYSIYNAEKSFEDLPDEVKGNDYLYAIDKNGNPYSPAWYTLNFKTMYQITENIIITAGIENITDQRYRPYSSGIAAAGRNMIFSARIIF